MLQINQHNMIILVFHFISRMEINESMQFFKQYYNFTFTGTLHSSLVVRLSMLSNIYLSNLALVFIIIIFLFLLFRLPECG